jgi:putative glycosyltransferase (TIGR04372 family)
MSAVDLRALIRVRQRISGFRARSWSSRVEIVRTTGLALLIQAVSGMLRGLLVAVYMPALVGARLLNIRFPYSHTLAGNYGHLTTDPAVFLKFQAVHGHADRRAVLVASRNRVVNRSLLEMWRSDFHLVSHPILAALLAPFKWSRLTRTLMHPNGYKLLSAQGELLEDGMALDEIEFRYASIGGREAMLAIDDDVEIRGRLALQDLGIPEGSWWVAFHVREGSYHGAEGSPRNVDPHAYLEAVKTVIDRGGYVIRIGDPGMSLLPPIDGLVDYAHSPAKSDWMDNFIIGCARFLLMSNSGPATVAQAFGVPVAAANWVPMCQGPMGHRDIRIPKLLLTDSPPATLSFDHVLGSDLLRDLHTEAGFSEAGIKLRDNTADEISALAIEMMDRLDAVDTCEPRDEELQRRFQDLIMSRNTPETHGSMSRVGKHFLRTHSALFERDRSSPGSRS